MGNGHLARWFTVVSLLALLTAIPSIARGQSALSGIVHDPTSRVAVGVTVTVDDNTGGRWEGVSNNIGYYEIALPPGEYNVIAYLDLASGQHLSYIGGVFVPPGENVGLDITLEYRNTEHITVDSRPAASPLLPVVDTALGVVFSREAIQMLPLSNGRTLQSFQALVPGVVFTDSIGTLAQFTAAGQRRFSNRLTIDGVSADLAIDVTGPGIGEAGSGSLPAVSTLGSTQTLVSLAAIEEIQVHTSSTSPEQQRSSGAQTVIITRSGGDRLIGSTFADWRPNGLAANDWFVNAGKAPKRQTTLTTAGASVGGPLYPGRIWYFAAAEWERVARSVSTTIQVPSDSSREAASANARALLDAFPRPNGQDLGDGLADLSAPFPADSRLNNVSVRLDMKPAARHGVFVRINRGASSGDELNQLQLPLLPATVTESTLTPTATVGFMSVLSSSATHDVRLNVSENRGSVVSSPASYGHAQALPLPLLVPSTLNPSNTWVSLRMFTDTSLLTVQSGRAAASAQRQIEIGDVVAYSRSRHTWRFGMDYRRRVAVSDGAPDRYTYTFADVNAVLQQRARLLLVQHAVYTEAQFQTWSTFAQDTFRVSPHLSLDYGVRYEVEPAPGSMTDTGPLLVRFEALPQIQRHPTGARLWATSWGNVAPHAAATYQLGTTAGLETTLHAGWSLVFDPLTSPGANAFGWGYPFRTLRAIPRSTLPVSADVFSAPAPEAFSSGDLNEYYAFSRDLHAPHIYSWRLGLDQALGHTQRLSVAYAGAAGRDLVYWQGYHIGGSNPLVHAFSNSASSDYHALLVEYTHRLSHGFQARATYAWSHAIDTDSGEPLTPHPLVSQLSASTNRGSADFDRRHVFEMVGSYQIPMPRIEWTILQSLCRGWQIDVVGLARSGGPVTVTSDRDLGFGTYTFRPDVVAGPSVWITDSTAPNGQRINPDAFVIPDTRQGTLGRNTLRASPLRQVDLSLSRSMRLGDRNTIQIRLDAFNVLNTTNFGPPDGDLGNVGFGFGQPRTTYAQSLGSGSLSFGGLTPLLQIGGPRSIQLGLRVNF